MSNRRWEVLVWAGVFTVLGLGCGWFAARQTGTPVAPGAAGGGGTQAPPKLPPATLKNLGVSVGPVQPTTFVKHREVPAVVAATPFTQQPVYAPIGGRVLEVKARPGLLVTASTTVVTLVRDPIPRPSLTLTGNILRPATEEIHRSVVELRKGREEVRIARTELLRVEKFTAKVAGQEYPVLPRQQAINLRYQLSRAQKAYEQAGLELREHGFSTEQIAQVAGGGSIPRLSEASWKRALERNGLWPELAEELYQSLPPAVRKLPWAIATVGELTAGGLGGPDLTRWLKTDPKAGEHFLELGSMLQRGHSLADLKRLYRLNALGAIVEVVAPEVDGGADWDVQAIHVKPGARVETGDPLLTLLNPRRMYLKTEPVGGEIRDLLRVISDAAPCTARPLVPGSGPELKDLTIAFITGGDPADRSQRTGASVAYVDVDNRPLATSGSGTQKRRSWALRSGMKYVLRIPTQKLDKVYVLPSDAVTDDGPHQVVFLQDGDSFRSVQVEIGYRDHEVVVIPINKHTAIFPGNPVVLRGAFALGLALNTKGAQLDAHHGHKH